MNEIFFVISKLSPEMFTACEVCKFKFQTVFAPEKYVSDTPIQ